MASVINILSFAIVVVVGWFIVNFVRQQQLGWAICVFVVGALAFAWVNDLGGFQKAMGDTFSNILKAIATEAGETK